MGNWVLGSAPDGQGKRELAMNIAHDDSTGHMNGTITLNGMAFQVTGDWAASGSVPGRTASAFHLGGSNQQDAPTYIATAGTMEGPGAAPQSVQINVITASSADGEDMGYNGKLTPM